MKLKLPRHDVVYVPALLQPYRVSPSANGRAEWTGDSGGAVAHAHPAPPGWAGPERKAWTLSSKENSACRSRCACWWREGSSGSQQSMIMILLSPPSPVTSLSQGFCFHQLPLGMGWPALTQTVLQALGKAKQNNRADQSITSHPIKMIYYVLPFWCQQLCMNLSLS